MAEQVAALRAADPVTAAILADIIAEERDHRARSQARLAGGSMQCMLDVRVGVGLIKRRLDLAEA